MYICKSRDFQETVKLSSVGLGQLIGLITLSCIKL